MIALSDDYQREGELFESSEEQVGIQQNFKGNVFFVQIVRFFRIRIEPSKGDLSFFGRDWIIKNMIVG